ncbi:MAG: hypothetical protein CSYNP_01937 [Syntrophus sp. SKADARSKE-3]|nr:hypothetical protein [Syntrophus sp. SKADARSKE-3]
MGSNSKQSQLGQKTSIERNLKDRLAVLAEKGLDSGKIEKDNLVKKFRANIKAINNRLKTIDANEKKTAELARLKAEKAAAPKKDPEAVKEKKVKAAEKPATAPAKEKQKKKA